MPRRHLLLAALALAAPGCGDDDAAPAPTTVAPSAAPATTIPAPSPAPTTVATTTIAPVTTTTVVLYAPATRDAFLEGCTPGAGEAACRCLLEQAEAEMAEADFVELADAYAAGGPVPDALRALAATCGPA